MRVRDTPYLGQDHKIITATQCFWVANGLTTASTNHLQNYITHYPCPSPKFLVQVQPRTKYKIVKAKGPNLWAMGLSLNSYSKHCDIHKFRRYSFHFSPRLWTRLPLPSWIVAMIVMRIAAINNQCWRVAVNPRSIWSSGAGPAHILGDSSQQRSHPQILLYQIETRCLGGEDTGYRDPSTVGARPWIIQAPYESLSITWVHMHQRN